MTSSLQEAYSEEKQKRDRDQMEEHANAVAKSTVGAITGMGYHSEDIDTDYEVIDTVSNAFQTIVDAMCEEGDTTLEYDRRNLLDNFVRQTEYMTKRKESALKSLAWKIGKAQRENDGTEIGGTNLQEAINDWKDCKRQGANFRKHLIPAAIEAWDQVIGEPRSSGKDGNRDVTTLDDLEANRIIQISGVGAKKRT